MFFTKIRTITRINSTDQHMKFFKFSLIFATFSTPLFSRNTNAFRAFIFNLCVKVCAFGAKIHFSAATQKKKKVLKPLSFKTFSMVGVPGFEPGASWTRTKRDTKLRHTPKILFIIMNFPGNVKVCRYLF